LERGTARTPAPGTLTEVRGGRLLATPTAPAPGGIVSPRRRPRFPVPGLILRFGIRIVFFVDVLSAAVALTAVGELGWRQGVAVAVTFLLYATTGLYDARLSLSMLDDLPVLVWRAVVGTTLVATATSVAGNAVPVRHLVSAGLATLVAVCVARTAFYALVRSARRSGRVEHRTLIIGAGRVGGRLATTLVEHPEYGLRPVGFCDADPLVVSEPLSLPTLGSPEQLASLLIEQRVSVVIVAFSSMREPQTVQILRTCDRLKCEIFVVPRLFELYGIGSGVDQVWGMPLVRLRRSTYRTVSWRLKRVFDVVVSAVALVVLAPVFLACAIAVRLEGGPGVLFRQERVGLDQRPFWLLKFRSLRPVNELESQTRWNVADDHRLGPVGRFLRQTSLDEMPQLINILRGDMTLVGPRPERPHFVDEFTRAFPRYAARHRVPAGLTGLAQVHGLRGDTSIEERAHFDNAYIENWSLWVDVKILLRTVGAVLRRAGR
jgi:exopolysaccharide biosynthesis polyprenyl glycosylphosphotransferase